MAFSDGDVGLLHSPIDQMDSPFDREKRLFLSSLRPSRAEKAQGKHFCSRRAMLCFAKMLLAAHRPLLRITLGGATAPPNHPGVFDFLAFTVAHSFMRTNIPVIKEDIAD